MHIPDGYLSPSTCACLYGAVSPFWYWSLRSVKRALNSRTIPLLSIFAALSFVVMMFNLPLPGGTTGHAVGVGVAAIVLGPAFSILAISIALFVQALFFGDGGISTFGANCFNMAVTGSMVSVLVYRLVAWKASVHSVRRVVAAGVAGYLAINVAAFLAAIEFGIQPLYFHDASGAPLYAPYPPSVAIPAMMIGHLTIAGCAECILTAGLIQYLQKSSPELLGESASTVGVMLGDGPAKKRPLRALWILLAVLLLLTPLGILAVGPAWGEWSTEELGMAHIPAGMQRLSHLWLAPLPDYSPQFITNAHAGYGVSAIAGVLLTVGTILLVRAALRFTRRPQSFLERTLSAIVTTLQDSLFAERNALMSGWLQRMDPRVKVVGFLLLLFTCLASRHLWVPTVVLGGVVVAAVSSRLPVASLVRVWIPILLFTGSIALPAIFLTPGQTWFVLPGLEWSVTRQGSLAAGLLLARAEAAASLGFLLTSTTVWPRLIGSLRFFSVPETALVLCSMAYRYCFVLLQSAGSLLESRQARLVGRLRATEQRRLATASVGVLLERAMDLSTDVELAMQARGFRGRARVLHEPSLRPLDWAYLCGAIAITVLLLVLAR